MTVLARALFVTLFFMLLLPCGATAVDETAGQERLGVRSGYIMTLDGLHDDFGDGWELTLYFTEKLYSKILLDIQVGAIYLGESRTTDVADDILLTQGTVTEMRFFYFSAGPLAGFRLGSSYSGYVSAGIGLYSVSLGFSSTVSAFDYSDQHVGFNGGVGLSRRIAANWSLEANSTAHYFSVDQNSNDLYYLFTDGADSPLLVGISLALTIDLR